MAYMARERLVLNFIGIFVITYGVLLFSYPSSYHNVAWYLDAILKSKPLAAGSDLISSG
jgi:hypothetical protein